MFKLLCRVSEAMEIFPRFVDEIVGEELGDFDRSQGVRNVELLNPEERQFYAPSRVDGINQAYHSNGTFSAWNKVP
jgi:hypothetical protein